MNPGGISRGRRVQIEGAYGTDPLVNGDGFRFDEVVVTNFEDVVPDAQSNVCSGGVNGLAIGDVTVTEGNAGTTTATFTVFLTPAAAGTVTVDFATADGSATVADNDYVATSNTLTFTTGQSVQTIDVTVNGDTQFAHEHSRNLATPRRSHRGRPGRGTTPRRRRGRIHLRDRAVHGYSELATWSPVGGANNDFTVLSRSRARHTGPGRLDSGDRRSTRTGAWLRRLAVIRARWPRIGSPRSGG